MHIANTRSGYAEAQLQLQQAQYNLQNTRLLAPFSGRVANLTLQEHEMASSAKAFCTLVNDKAFEVSFSLLETEYQWAEKGTAIHIVPLAVNGQKYDGSVTRINPLVDKNGLIQVTATVPYSQGLLSGMNLKVYLRKEVENQLVVPRSAVVLDGKDRDFC